MPKAGIAFLGGLLVGLLATGILFLLTAEPRGEPISLQPPPTPCPVRIHITGAVSMPGVYELPNGSIVQQALETAGGPTSNAALEAINLAAPLHDGQQILVPTQKPTPSSLEPQSSSSAIEDSRVNINLADTPDLEKLPGIGPKLAQKIVDYREAYGPFTCCEDLLKISGIGPAKLEELRDMIIVP